MNKINQQTGDKIMDTENQLTTVRIEEFEVWLRRVKELSKKRERENKNKRLKDTDKIIVNPRGRGA